MFRDRVEEKKTVKIRKKKKKGGSTAFDAADRYSPCVIHEKCWPGKYLPTVSPTAQCAIRAGELALVISTALLARPRDFGKS